MTMTGALIVVRALEDEGIELAFGIPGTHNIELYDALAVSKSVLPVLVTDEQSASFAADGAWRASGRLACVNVVPGAGLTHALSGIAEAFMDNVPLLVLGCGIRRDTGRAFQLHDVDQRAMVRPVTKAQLLPETGEDLYLHIRRACRIAREGAPGPVFVEVPANLYLTTHAVDLEALSKRRISSHEVIMMSESGLKKATELLKTIRQPLIYAGLGAAGAALALLEFAERLGAPVCTTFSGKGVFPESRMLALWPGFGAAAPPFVNEVIKSCDATIAIGCKFGEVATASYGIDPPRPLIHIDIDPKVIDRNFPADVGITGDAREVLPLLLRAAPARTRSHMLPKKIKEGHDAVRKLWEAQDGAAVSPYRLLAALQRRFGPETVYTTDSGNGTFLAMEMLRLDSPGKFLAPVDYSCMGYAVPAAIGAKLARPECPVVALAGDGAFLMTGLELLTASHLGVGVACIVLRDRELGQIAQFQEVAMNRKTASVLPDYDLAPLAQSLGVECVKLDRNDQIDTVLARVMDVTAAGRPIVVDCAIDYSHKTYFTKGVVKTNLLRMGWSDRLRFIGRAAVRKVLG